MHLEEIRIYGFKTFKDNVRIVLSPKVTCIVGPNGSGKSNIVDAVRWALGEQRLSLLRAKETPDLIFSGSAFKKQLSVASVKLIFNNEDHLLALKTPRVVIERRLYRSRESHYFVNDEEMRLQDVMGLFYSAKIYGHMYAIVGQGKVEALLLERPEQKKTLIDQVAGVEIFKKKKREALRELEKAEENLLRVKDRFQELKKTATRISTEAKKAHLYYTVKDRLKRLEDTMLNSEIQQAEKEVTRLKSGIEEINRRLEHIANSLAEKTVEEAEVLKKEEDIKNDKNSLRNEKEKILIEETKLREKEKYLKEKKENFAAKKENFTQKIKDGDCKVASLTEDVGNLSRKMDNLIEMIKKEKEEIQSIEKKISEMKISVMPLIEEARENEKVLESIREERIKNEKLLSVVEFDMSRIEEEINELEINMLDVEKLEELDIATIKDRTEKAYLTKKELEMERKKLEEQILLLDYEIKSDAKFINEKDTTRKRHYEEGTLGNLLHLKESMPGIEEELKMKILSSVKELSKKENGKFFIEDDLVDIKEKEVDGVRPLSFVVHESKGFLKGMYAAESLATGRAFFKEYYDKLFIKKVITKDGFVLYSPYEVWCKDDLAVQEKIKELDKKKKQNSFLKEKLKHNDLEISKANDLIFSLQKELDRGNEINARRNELIETEKRISVLTKKLREKEKEKESIKAKIRSLLNKTGAENKSETLIDKEQSMRLLQEDLQRKVLRVTEDKYKLEKISDEAARMNGQIKFYIGEINELKGEREKFLEEFGEIENELHGIEEELHNIFLKVKKLENENSVLDGRESKVIQERKRIAAEVLRLNGQKEELLRKMEKQRIAVAEKNIRTENLKSSMEEKEIERREIGYEVDKDRLKGEIKELKEKMESLGAIDFTSLEEEEKVMEELKEKETVYKDVSGSKRKIEKFIKEMDGRIKEEFENTLNQVEELFSKFFRRMFLGGEAGIERFYDDSDEVKGIELNVRLPGRKKQSLPLLSGGEKSLLM
jgi:chromosome segregation protein